MLVARGSDHKPLSTRPLDTSKEISKVADLPDFTTDVFWANYSEAGQRYVKALKTARSKT
jgi:hypothetical protein